MSFARAVSNNGSAIQRLIRGQTRLPANEYPGQAKHFLMNS